MAEGMRGPERRIVLVGKTGNGKSATGNTILGGEFFHAGITSHSRTKFSQKEEIWWNGRKIVVVDTPGFFDTDVSPQTTAAQVKKCVSYCHPGPHVILQVMRPGHFSEEEKQAAQLISDIFSLEARNYIITLFTRKEDLEDLTLEDYLSKANISLKAQMANCGHRYLSFNNRAQGEEREAQVAQLMTMIDELVQKNTDAPCYTEEMMKKDEEQYKEKKYFWCTIV